jgi:putative lumazine-binding protein
MTSETSETTAIERALWTYLDGLYEGDADKIAAAFHPVSHLYSEAKGEVADVPRDKWLDMVRTRPSPKSQGHPRHDRIVTIDQSGPTTAFAKVECAMPPRFFVDYLTLLKTGEGWRIVAKAFKTETR